jgi:hypothetical protein
VEADLLGEDRRQQDEKESAEMKRAGFQGVGAFR